MRKFYVRRKDLDHVPFQFYVSSAGVAQSMDEGYTGVFAIIPPKNDIDVFYVRIVNELAHELEENWGISQADLLRVAAMGVQAWLKDQAIPTDHFYGPEWMKMDRDWYLRESDGSPAMAADPYSFEVVSDEPWPSILDWDYTRRRDELSPAAESNASHKPAIVFGFTLDVFPAMLIVGYEQMKHKVAGLGLDVDVSLLPLDDLPSGLHTLFVPVELEHSARLAAPQASVYALPEMVNVPIYDTVIRQLENEQRSEMAIGHA